eukprot:2512538-Alexandrium_andersonii.AAC.1
MDQIIKEIGHNTAVGLQGTQYRSDTPVRRDPSPRHIVYQWGDMGRSRGGGSCAYPSQVRVSRGEHMQSFLPSRRAAGK